MSSVQCSVRAQHCIIQSDFEYGQISNNAAAVESLEREEENESNNKSVKQASLVLLFIML